MTDLDDVVYSTLRGEPDSSTNAATSNPLGSRDNARYVRRREMPSLPVRGLLFLNTVIPFRCGSQ